VTAQQSNQIACGTSAGDSLAVQGIGWAWLEDPARQWKISEADYKEREYWDDYIAAFEEMLRKTSTEYAPWFVIPSNHKWFRDLAVSHIITSTLEKLDMKLPKPTVDLADIKRKYHATAAEEKASKDK
jgi:hypothetical protein